MMSAVMTTIKRSEDEQLAAVRTLLNVDAGMDVVEPLKELIANLRHVRLTLQVVVAMNEATIRNLKKQVQDIQVILEDWK